MRLIAGLIIGLALTTAAPDLCAQNRKHDDDQKNAVAVSITFGRNDERLVREWFSQLANLKGLPPGLAKKEQLPPGLQRQLVRNGRLPPGLQKNIQPLPAAIEVKLSPLPQGQKRIFISGKVILFDERKNVVLDMFGVF